MINVVVTGNIGADCETKVLSGGTVVNEFRMASNSKTKDGDHTDWVRVAFFGDRAKFVPYLVKGTQVAVRGTMTVREFTTNGEKRFSLEVRADDVQLMGSTKSNGASAGKGHGTSPSETDDIPF